MNPEKADFLGRKRRRRSEGAGAWTTAVGSGNGGTSGNGGSGGFSGGFSPPVDFNGALGSQSGGLHLVGATPTNGSTGGTGAVAPPVVIAPKRPSLGRGVSVSEGDTSLYLNPDIEGAAAMELLQLAERVCHIAEIHLVSINR